MTRDRLIWLLAALGLVMGGWWLQANTEWADEDTQRGAQGEARDNPVYAAEQLLRRLGVTAAHHEALGVLPPPPARLVLMSSDWSLIPGRAERLRQWVVQGGHLVLMHDAGWGDTPLGGWVPVKETASTAADAAASPQKASPGTPAASVVLATWAEQRLLLASSPPLWGTTETLQSCEGAFSGRTRLHLEPGHVAAWTLTRAERTRPAPALQAAAGARDTPADAPAQAFRVALGQGSVTVLNAHSRGFYGASALRCDNPLLLAAAVQAEPGATVWIYLHEKREALLPWLWHTGWIALVAGGLALAASLWRASVRFGPRLAPAPRLRRSISEQVRGLAAYLQNGGRDALLAAQQRALHDAAARLLRGYARLSLAERARAVAAATGLPAHELAVAMTTQFCTRAALQRHLPLLEVARRRLHRPPEESHPPS